MNFGIRNMSIAALAAAALVAALPVQASANHQFGHAVAGGIIGGIIGGAIANANRPAYGQPVYVQPAPVYVQPAPVYRCSWQNVQVWDPYIGANVWRRQQVCG